MADNIFTQLATPASPTQYGSMLAEHRQWLHGLNKERPDPEKPYHIGVYIRFFNQTRYADYLEKHISQFSATIALCPQWNLVDYYIDHGSTAPKMESSPEWSRLLEDCMAGKVDLILTQKVSNVSSQPLEMSICAQILAAHTPPIGIYFISEDIFTLASYYLADLYDTAFLLQGEDL